MSFIIYGSRRDPYTILIDHTHDDVIIHTMLITTALEHIHTWSGRYPDITLTDRQLFQITEHFIRTLPRDHHVPGAVWNQMVGEMDWYREHGSLTPKQRHWLMHSLREHVVWL